MWRGLRRSNHRPAKKQTAASSVQAAKTHNHRLGPRKEKSNPFEEETPNPSPPKYKPPNVPQRTATAGGNIAQLFLPFKLASHV
jgi:hypothetical protein